MNSGAPETKVIPQRWWLRALGLVWLAGFLAWFYSFPLPYGQLADGTSLSRMDIWFGLPDVLWENVSATPDLHASPSGWKYLSQRFDLIAVAVCILGGAWAWGFLTLRLLRLHRSFDTPSRFVFAAGLGLSELSLMTLGCGRIGFLDRPLLGSVVFAALVAEVFCRIRRNDGVSNFSDSLVKESTDITTNPRKSGGKPSASWRHRRWDVLPAICLLIVAPFVMAMFLGAMLPSTDFDVKEYHLEGPKEHFLQGRVTFLPHNVYTSFPFLTEMLALLAMVMRDDWFRGALAGKVVLMSMAPLTALGLFAAGRRWFGSTVGWLCVIIYLSIPWVYRISIIAYAEGGLTFFLFATLLAVMWLTVEVTPERPDRAGRGTRDAVRSTQHSGAAAKRFLSDRSAAVGAPGTDSRSDPLRTWPTGHILLCGLLAGSAAACKYPGLLSVVVPLGAYLLFAQWYALHRVEDRQLRPDAVGANPKTVLSRVAATAVLLTVGTLMTFGPWMAKNMAETGNPVYPLLYGVFGGRDWDEAAHQKWQNAHPPMITRFVKEPRSIPGNFTERVTDVAARSDWQSPLVFGCAPLALCWIGRRRIVLTLWGYVGWLYLTWWTLTHHMDRFWVPMLPAVTLLAGMGLGWLLKTAFDDSSVSTARASRLSSGIGLLTCLLVGPALLFNLGFVTTRLCGYNAYLIDLDAAKRNTTTPSIAFLSARLPEGARVLIVGGAEVFDAPFDYAYNTVFDESLFERWTSAAVPGLRPAEQPLRPADDIRETFRQQGITHVFVDWNEVLRHRIPGGYGFTDFVTPQRFRELVEAGVLNPIAVEAGVWKDADQNTQAEVERWGPLLHLKMERDEALLKYELFATR